MYLWKHSKRLINSIHCREFHNSQKLQIKGKSTFDLIERPNSAIEKEWFKESAEISSRRKNSKGLHFVFLEGSAGCGKNDVLNRLSKMGYQTFSKSFVQLFQVPIDKFF